MVDLETKVKDKKVNAVDALKIAVIAGLGKSLFDKYIDSEKGKELGRDLLGGAGAGFGYNLLKRLGVIDYAKYQVGKAKDKMSSTYKNDKA
jgi:hypothetical protein